MSTLKVKQIKSRLLEMFEEHLDLSDLNPKDSERENKILSRCLAAFAIYAQASCSAEEAAASVWDGTDDNGVDAAFLDANESRVILVQAKWMHAGSGEPSASDVAVFANGVHDIVEQEQANFGVRLHSKLHEIGQSLNVPGTTIEVVLITTGASSIAKHGTANLDRVLKDLNGVDGDEPLASCQILGLAEIYNALGSGPIDLRRAI